MIPLFTLMYKTNYAKVPTGLELYESIASKFKPLSSVCPTCGTRGYMKEHDSYGRWLIDYSSDIQEYNVRISRVKCHACTHTHAVLPDVLIPYKSYCILFILLVLKKYFFTHAATAICAKYKISTSTLYAWRDKYLTHAALELGAIVEAALLTATRWLADAGDICRTASPSDFHGRFGFLFLQNDKTARFSSA